MGSITIAGKALGRRRQLFDDWSIPLTPDWGHDGGLTLRELITRIVLAEVTAFKERQSERRLTAVLTTQQIEEAMDRGKVDAGGIDSVQRHINTDVDKDSAVAAAIQAFEDGMYIVVIDGAERRDLDEQVYLQDDSRVTFVKLIFLAGA